MADAPDSQSGPSVSDQIALLSKLIQRLNETGRAAVMAMQGERGQALQQIMSRFIQKGGYLVTLDAPERRFAILTNPPKTLVDFWNSLPAECKITV